MFECLVKQCFDRFSERCACGDQDNNTHYYIGKMLALVLVLSSFVKF